MSAAPTSTATDLLTIHVDDVEIKVAKGSMIIEATDRVGIEVPRFCYHPKLSIAANCRMCLVDVEKAPKPMPACATPVMDGMKVYTRSKRALDAQRGVMEFLLINHPLDCPICDQGGECELQDQAMGYGRSVSRFTERKRVVADENIGPLIATDMTRCIHCTRCVRFLEEVAGTNEFGGMNRGEQLEIGTYIGRALESELSGNIIDLCPVGALTNKPFRYRARAWELIARDTIACHDALGSNLYLHIRRGQALRAVPRDNEAINESWLSDRDRYAIAGMYADDRATRPLLRKNADLVEVDWDEAIAAAAEGLKAAVQQYGAEGVGVLVSPMATSEELHLLQKLARGLGIVNIDHRLRQLDFADDDARGLLPGFELPLAQIEKVSAALILGGNPRHDAPILGHRLRKAFLHGAAIYAVNPVDFDFHFNLRDKLITPSAAMVDSMLQLAAAAARSDRVAVPAALADALKGVEADETAQSMVKGLIEASDSVIIFGQHGQRHAQASWLRLLARYLAEATGSAYNELPDGGNAADAWRLGVLPHRLGGGMAASARGRNAREMIEQPLRAYVTWQCEAPQDFVLGGAAKAALDQADFVLHFSAFASEQHRQSATLILPVGVPAETEGHLRNADGELQRLSIASKLPGDGRQGWRVLRALGNALGVSGFEFTELGEVVAEIDAVGDASAASEPKLSERPVPTADGYTRIATTPIYAGDALQRRAPALQATPMMAGPRALLHPEDALALGVSGDAELTFIGDAGTLSLRCGVSARVPRSAIWIEDANTTTAILPPDGAVLQIERKDVAQ